MFIESIESRVLMAGNVTVQITPEQLNIVGDAAANTFVVSRSGDVLTVTGSNGTTIDGQDERRYDTRSRYVFSLGNGHDSVTASGTLPSLFVNGGNGDDTFMLLDAAVTGSLYFSGRAGTDKLWIKHASVSRDVNAAGGSGVDRVFVDRASVRRDFVFGDQDRSSRLDLDTLSVRGATTLKTGNSIDHLTITDSTFVKLATVTLRGGDDQATVRGSIFKTPSPFDAGTGDNRIDREVLLSWDFRNGSQGWEGLFASYPEGQITGKSVDGKALYAEDTYQLHFGESTLRTDELPLTSTLSIAGTNASDALQMYIATTVNAGDGIVGKVRYKVSYDIAFASDFSADTGPNLVRTVAGVLPTPVRKRFNTISNTTDLIADFGSPANPIGRNGRFFGDIRHNRTFDEVGGQFVAQTQSLPDAGTAVAGANAELALLVGTASMYETRTILHYLRVSARLTPV